MFATSTFVEILIGILKLSRLQLNSIKAFYVLLKNKNLVLLSVVLFICNCLYRNLLLYVRAHHRKGFNRISYILLGHIMLPGIYRCFRVIR